MKLRPKISAQNLPYRIRQRKRDEWREHKDRWERERKFRDRGNYQSEVIEAVMENYKSPPSFNRYETCILILLVCFLLFGIFQP